MIDKLTLSPINIKKENYELGLFDKTSEKINELVDAVNELQLTVSKMENLEHLKKIGQGFTKRNI